MDVRPGPRLRSRPGPGGFTLAEVLVAVVLAILILVVLLAMITQVSTVWRRSAGKVEAFQSARVAFDLLSRDLSQATLNAYLDYDDPTAATRYLRKSELAFVLGPAGASGLPGTPGTGQAVFFQAPLRAVADASRYGATESLLNACGYYVAFSEDTSLPAHVAGGRAGSRYRYRLLRLLVPAEANTIYKLGSAGTGWFAGAAAQAAVSPVADNVIALVLRPQDPSATPPDLGAAYAYDTRLGVGTNPQPATANQLPPVLQVTLVALDEASARRLAQGTEPPGVLAAAMKGKFAATARYDADLADLEAALDAAHLGYRVFAAAVPLRESRWSKP